MAYYNTTNETGTQLEMFTKINEGQDRRVLQIVKEIKTFSASKVWKYYCSQYSDCPLTSIRRSINTLKKVGYISETGQRVPGIYGRNELEYKYVL